MKVICCQLDIDWENKAANYAKVRSMLTAAAIPKGSLVLLPEMFATGFSMNVAQIREGRPPETEEFLARTAREFGVFMLGGVINTAADGQGRNEATTFSPEGKEIARYCKMQPFTAGGESKHYVAGEEVVTFAWQNFVVAPFMLGGVINTAADGRGRNEAVVFSPEGKEIARYCKMQPFTAGGESKHYVAGEEVVTFAWQNFVVAPFICYDLRFPELFRIAIRRRAQLFTVIANWPVARIQHWITLLQARAIENQAYVAGVNRCGTDPKLSYNGRSLIIDPHGEILADAGGNEGLISADLDLAGLVAWRAKFPALQDMRSDFGDR